MKRKIIIRKRKFLIPYEIKIDDVSYPIHRWNLDVIKEYEVTKDETVLEKLKSFSLDF
jgi:hypothetical protein